MTANDLKTYCEEILNLAGWHVFRINAGYSGRWNVRQAPDGTPDIIGCDRDGRYVGLEIKVGRDQLRESQKEELERIAKRGGIARVITCKEDVEALLK
jgi:hypothetical protein